MSAASAESVSSASFEAKLNARVGVTGAALCVGLDPHAADVPSADGAGLLAFCKRIIDATKHVAVCYKPNSAFFEAKGADGLEALAEVIRAIPDDIPVLLDVKRGDIGSTSAAYASSAFEHLKVDAVTISPYMGWDSVAPFVSGSFSSKGVFVLCKTSNPSSADFQTEATSSGSTMFEKVASKSLEWNSKTEALVGLVVGATDADALRRARAAAPDLWILAPGVGAQGGSLEDAVATGSDASGGKLLVPVSRGISRAEDPKAAAEQLLAGLKAAGEAKRKAGSEIAPGAASSSTKAASTTALLPHQRDFLQNAIESSVLRFGSFTLKSGRESPYFFNAGLFDSGGAVMRLGRSYAECIRRSGIEFDVLFGPAYKGIPLATTVAVALADQHELSVPVAYNRKEAKDHGEGGVLVGAKVEGRRVLLVDDVISAGTAVGEAAGLLAAAGAELAGVIVGLDRQEVGKDGVTIATQAVREKFGVPVVAVATLSDLIAFAESSSSSGTGAAAGAASGASGGSDAGAGLAVHVEAIRAYRSKYGGTLAAGSGVGS